MIEERQTTVDQSEIDHFSRIATEWWNPQGKFRPLHQFNPTRLAYIREKICLEFNRDPISLTPFDNLKVLDIGCGGGLLCEPMARLGAIVVGVDAAQTNIEVAKIHAAQNNLSIDYRTTTAEALANEGEKFDIILNMEVVEHVADVNLFIKATAKMLKPQGLMFVATLNRTWKAWGLAIVGAEYILRWLPKGTHDYKKFLKPRELKKFLSQNALTVIDETGITYNPLNDSWNRSKDMDVNYLLLAKRS
ncbi:bifunctional 2-polyprenyl-6-hydroxyphenol methylase/3-demethylubiquinol 3-O-methyltransferase UbiG [Bartonella krasnovii]|uniref:Ubiquinone biosynthesis O-methyltransferase n=1 Tax=Bartonella krasnovii TaxID=2267275 RepID=A0A5B9CZI3_9HYPH|nr:bifunctional 2-polyprenyl-6-hydroxyphenol methylase/3-demethylubiquinol 3-O-methyltransferase UbiG [Bartonella krasnovii]QEE11648.1 bifunctional 2-polyprenyl-6-hydroxyphenol methylase/3-demethylubiquinol 3-O-methyltransferase UbiG [Bartonella krasnovii]UNF42466.1 bifunctional 2-polyprenyl-6-hydroxyphenol methylase/3-demethylubiquinol 3-O-methyltransferase UbiG [Bartonella krasnovii]UNF53978.1 bifunctional 2-polyprenyl-6-hydroxyphenol methylase/3-demethylubiquinol 3-O-methyltransferase UbiG [B